MKLFLLRPNTKDDLVIIGARLTPIDVNQPEIGQIAAVVASVDPRSSQYCCEVILQTSEHEYIEDIGNMLYRMLRKFDKSCGAKSFKKQPIRIIVYRDTSDDPLDFQNVRLIHISCNFNSFNFNFGVLLGYGRGMLCH